MSILPRFLNDIRMNLSLQNAHVSKSVYVDIVTENIANLSNPEFDNKVTQRAILRNYMYNVIFYYEY